MFDLITENKLTCFAETLLQAGRTVIAVIFSDVADTNAIDGHESLP